MAMTVPTSGPTTGRSTGPAMSDRIAESRRRHAEALQMGGAQAVDRHRASGRLPVRERIALVADEGSWFETGALAQLERRTRHGRPAHPSRLPVRVAVGRARLHGAGSGDPHRAPAPDGSRPGRSGRGPGPPAASPPAAALPRADHFETELHGPVALLRISRPDKLNALTAAFWPQLRGLLDAVAERAAIRAVVLTGSGDRSFSTGGD